MQIWIHDSKMKKIVALNNDIPEMLHYSNSAWHPYLEQATSTFDFTIPKFVNGKLHEDIKLITDECFVSFYINGSHQVFYIATLQGDDFNIQLTCNNTNLEYALEDANPFSVDSAQTIEWYLNHMDLLSFAAVELGYNEIPDSKRTLTFDSQETKMARLQSLMSNFDAEFEFKVELNRDGTYKRIVINIYQKADETHHGIGSDRKDVVLYYSNGLKGVQSSSDKTQMFNAGVFTGKDGLSLNDVEISEKNADGIEEFYSRKGNPCLYAPLAMNRYRATMRAEGQDNWIRKDFTTEYENINDLKAYALRTLKQYAYPLMTYTASVQSDFIGQYTDLKLGDTVKIIDNNFAGGLALEARVSEMIISFDNPNNNSLVFTNYRRIDNKPTSALQSRIDKAVEDRLPYRIELATTGGVTFKNNEGESLVQPRLYKGGKPFTTDVSWRWALDGVVTVGMQYLVKAKDIDDTAVLTVAGYVGNTEVATTEITLTNVNDGPQGPQGPKGDQGIQGPKGADGKTQYTHIAYADNDTGGGFSQTDQNKAYIGMYVDFTEADSNDPTKYRWTKWKGSDGAQGIPGTPGEDGRTPYIHFAYADDDKGTNFSLTDNNQQYQGYYSDYTEADSTDYTKYKWVDRLANVQVDFRNLLAKTNQGKTNWMWDISGGLTTAEDYNVDGVNAVKLTRTSDSLVSWAYIRYRGLIRKLIEPNTKYTLSFDVYPSQDVTFTASLRRADYGAPLTNSATMNKATANQWTKVSCVLTSVATLPDDLSQVVYLGDMPVSKGNYLIIKNIKLGEGNIPTPWSPALEDTQEQIDSKADQTLTQDQLNALAEKNNIIKAEMEAKATIDTVNQWITAYQNYVNANDADKARSEQALKDASERILGIRYEVDNLKVVWDAIDTYMSFQNEGLVIGKKDGSAYAKFSDDRISLFSGSSEVMYISQGTLNIANGIFTKTIQIGRFRFETHPADADMLVVRFVGG